MYDITEKGKKQYRRVKVLIYGLYILIPLAILMGYSSNPIEIDELDEPTQYQEPNDLWEQCEPFLNHDAEAWSNCMMIA